jgi:hypothetical protein
MRNIPLSLVLGRLSRQILERDGKGTVPNAGESDAEGVEEVEEVLYSAVLSPVGRIAGFTEDNYWT